jgi:ubiquinone/menaquinone biosynthesis C-methylase UbiE
LTCFPVFSLRKNFCTASFHHSIDNDAETFPNAKRKLGELLKFVDFMKADLANMQQIKSESVDLIVCHATICAVNDKPLKAVKSLAEFDKALKKGAG